MLDKLDEKSIKLAEGILRTLIEINGKKRIIDNNTRLSLILFFYEFISKPSNCNYVLWI